MFRRFFITILTSMVVIITGYTGGSHLKDDNSVESDAVNTIEEVKNETAEEIGQTIDETNEAQNITEEVPEEIQNEKQSDQEAKKDTNESKKIVNSEAKTTSKTESKTEGKKQCQTTTTTTQSQTQNNKSSSTSTTQKTEETVFNNTAYQKIVADINEIARNNLDLWDVNGNKLYKIQKSPSLVGKNYMSPYRKGNVSGIVLNTFPCTFLVYAVDYSRPGFTTETRYYIDISEY